MTPDDKLSLCIDDIDRVNKLRKIVSEWFIGLPTQDNEQMLEGWDSLIDFDSRKFMTSFFDEEFF